MKSKKLLCAVVATAVTMSAAGMAFSGCVTVNNEEDFKQVIGEVNVGWEGDKVTDEFNFTEQQIEKVFTTETILKRDLVIGYVSNGSNYTNSGYSTSAAYQAILDGLVENIVVTQYSVAKLIENKLEGGEGSFDLDIYAAKTTNIAKYEYLLGESSEEVKTARYMRDALLNSTLDTYETRIINPDDEEYSGTDSRAVPTGIDSYTEDYIPENYNVYTGYGSYTKGNAGEDYEGVDGTNKYTRQRSVEALIKFLKDSYLITTEDLEHVKSHDILSLSYVKETYASYLEQEITEKYSDMYVDGKESELLREDGGVYVNIKDEYDNVVEGEYTKQANKYSDASTFESALSEMSDTSFVLYSPKLENANKSNYRYGYVYNILLPFSTAQETKLSELQTLRDKDLITDSDYFYARNQLLRDIETTDQRAAWFNGTTDYSFNVKDLKTAAGGAVDYFKSEDETRSYLFFENNLLKSNADSGVAKYEKLTRYDGRYGYNGRVSENENGSYTLVPNKLTIDGMLDEFCAYIDYVLGNASNTTKATVTDAYYGTKSFTSSDDEDKIDYSKLVYASGKVNLFDGLNASIDMFNPASARYKAMAAVNELQYAYTTDTGVLSQYIGYSVTPYNTSYIKEFEYAAQEAIAEGVGAFKVCAGDYGWHLIYVTEVYDLPDGGATYVPDWSVANDRINLKGTFEYNFYNWKKDSILASEASNKRSAILYDFNSETTAKLFKDAYKDLVS